MGTTSQKAIAYTLTGVMLSSSVAAVLHHDEHHQHPLHAPATQVGNVIVTSTSAPTLAATPWSTWATFRARIAEPVEILLDRVAEYDAARRTVRVAITPRATKTFELA